MKSIQKPQSKTNKVSWGMTIFLLTNAGILLLLIVALVWFGSVGASLAFLRGDPLVVDTYSKSIGSTVQGDGRQVAFQVTNRTNRPITLLGAKMSCSCIAVDDDSSLGKACPEFRGSHQV